MPEALVEKLHLYKCQRCGENKPGVFGLTIKHGGLYQLDDEWTDVADLSLCADCSARAPKAIAEFIKLWMQQDPTHDKA